MLSPVFRHSKRGNFGSDAFESSIISKNSVVSKTSEISLTFTLRRLSNSWNFFDVTNFQKYFFASLRVLGNYRNFRNFLFWKSEHTSENSHNSWRSIRDSLLLWRKVYKLILITRKHLRTLSNYLKRMSIKIFIFVRIL